MSTPTYEDMIGLEIPNQVEISPQGKKILYTVSTPNWKDNEFIESAYLYDVEQKSSSRLSRTLNITQSVWIDDQSLLILANRSQGSDVEKKGQIYYYEHLIGEPLQLTTHRTGITEFKYKNGRLFYIAKNPDLDEQKERKEKFGDFIHQEEETSADTIYYSQLTSLISFAERRSYQLEEDLPPDPVLDLRAYLQFSRTIFGIFPDGEQTLVINTRDKDDLIFLNTNNIYRLELEFDRAVERWQETKKQEDGDEGRLIDFQLEQYEFPRHCSVVDLSPDGNQLLISYSEDGSEFYQQSDLYISPVESIQKKTWKKISGDIERDFFMSKWAADGIYVTYADYSSGKLCMFTHEGDFVELDTGTFNPYYYFSISENGLVAYRGANSSSAVEVVLKSENDVYVLTHFSDQIENWNLGLVESIEWESSDGTTIEGVIHYPPDFDPNKRYPTVFVVHGGPTSLNFSYKLEFVDLHYYPVPLFVNRGIIVVKPNYRGSVGRNKEFKQLNKGNIGTGDQWDLESCIDYLDHKGIIDTDNIGCMGWSQGGFISAFMGTHSDKIKAVSMGAGISSWYTYWASNDIRQWAHHYLLGSPREQPQQYEITAPISKVDETTTPFLIQHGQNDQRVPLSNALEMHRRLKDIGTPVELFIFKGMPHGITKPREQKAVMHQNYTWFTHHLLGDDLDFFYQPDQTKE